MSSIAQIKSRKFYDNENETGLDRIKNLYKDVFRGVVRAEFDFIANMFVYSFCGGALWRTFFGSEKILKEFQLRNNASVFLGKTHLKKELLFFTLERLAQRGFNFGSKCAALTTATSFLAMHSFVYRKDVYVLDLSTCFGVAFALTRYNRGLRSFLSTFVIGFSFGFINSLVLKGAMKYKGITLKDLLDEKNKDLNIGSVPVEGE